MKNNWVSYLALGTSIVALMFAYFRLEPIKWGIDATNLLVDVLAILVTILIGFQIFNYLSFERNVDRKVSDIKKEIVSQFQEYIAGVIDFSKAYTKMIRLTNYVSPDDMELAFIYRCFLSAIVHFVNYKGDENVEQNINDCFYGLIYINTCPEVLIKYAKERPDEISIDRLKDYVSIENEDFLILKSKILLFNSFKWTEDFRKKFNEIESDRANLTELVNNVLKEFNEIKENESKN